MTTAPKIAGFMYHDVSEDPATSGFQRPRALPYKLSTRAFAEHLAQIATAPVAPVLVTDIDLTRRGRHLLLTFDDGGKSAVTISELLSRHGWKGHFLVVTSLIGSRTFLDAAQIRAIRSAGHLIGSHSHSHPNIYRELPVERMVEEWRSSCDLLTQLLGEQCLTASVPGGDISRRVLTSASMAGLRYLFTSEPWLTPRRVDDCWILGRFSTKVGTSSAQIRELAHFRGWRTARVGRSLKVLAGRIAPPLYRLYMRDAPEEDA